MITIFYVWLYSRYLKVSGACWRWLPQDTPWQKLRSWSTSPSQVKKSFTIFWSRCPLWIFYGRLQRLGRLPSSTSVTHLLSTFLIQRARNGFSSILNMCGTISLVCVRIKMNWDYKVTFHNNVLFNKFIQQHLNPLLTWIPTKKDMVIKDCPLQSKEKKSNCLQIAFYRTESQFWTWSSSLF